MRITGKTDGPLPRDKKLDQLRVAAVKLNLIESDALYQIDRFFIIFIFCFGKTQQ